MQCKSQSVWSFSGLKLSKCAVCRKTITNLQKGAWFTEICTGSDADKHMMLVLQGNQASSDVHDKTIHTSWYILYVATVAMYVREHVDCPVLSSNHSTASKRRQCYSSWTIQTSRSCSKHTHCWCILSSSLLLDEGIQFNNLQWLHRSTCWHHHMVKTTTDGPLLLQVALNHILTVSMHCGMDSHPHHHQYLYSSTTQSGINTSEQIYIYRFLTQMWQCDTHMRARAHTHTTNYALLLISYSSSTYISMYVLYVHSSGK